MVKIAVHSAEGCCTATTMALTSSKQKSSRLHMNSSFPAMTRGDDQFRFVFYPLTNNDVAHFDSLFKNSSVHQQKNIHHVLKNNIYQDVCCQTVNRILNPKLRTVNSIHFYYSKSAKRTLLMKQR